MVLANLTAQTTQSDMLALLGGEAGVTATVAEFHLRLLADPSLAPAFAGLDMAVLRRHHIQLLNYLLGGPGPQPVTAAGLRASHLPHRVTAEQFAAVVAHLIASLPQDPDTHQVIPDIAERLNWLQPHVVYDQIKRLHSDPDGTSAMAAAKGNVPAL
jgi:hemoglobin